MQTNGIFRHVKMFAETGVIIFNDAPAGPRESAFPAALKRPQRRGARARANPVTKLRRSRGHPRPAPRYQNARAYNLFKCSRVAQLEEHLRLGRIDGDRFVGAVDEPASGYQAPAEVRPTLLVYNCQPWWSAAQVKFSVLLAPGTP